jgi:hypothetical protein
VDEIEPSSEVAAAKARTDTEERLLKREQAKCYQENCQKNIFVRGYACHAGHRQTTTR